MKEKKQRNKNRATIIACMFVFGLIAIIIGPPLVVERVWYNNTIAEQQEELASYSPDTYEYLLETLKKIFKENEKIIDLNSKPDDIIIEKLEKQDNKYVCRLRLDNGKTREYFPVADITAEISEYCKILSTDSAYFSESTYVNAFKDNIRYEARNIQFNVILWELLIWVILAMAVSIMVVRFEMKNK